MRKILLDDIKINKFYNLDWWEISIGTYTVPIKFTSEQWAEGEKQKIWRALEELQNEDSSN